jgi:hypothetical protein
MKKLTLWGTYLFAFFLPLMVFAQTSVPVTDPTDLGGALGFLPTIWAASSHGQWLLAGAFLSIVLTFLVKQYLLPRLNIGNGILPIVSIVIGVVSGAGLAVANGSSLLAAVLATMAGPLGSSLYEAIVKYFLPSAAVPAPTPAPAPAPTQAKK